ncbi:unnamed protein product [Strongylus vulgaris]|uniref:Uncharacterized protein n=1 Tax=Strongylus vulgaris TaxID=40348 RepID=A0A3P7LQL0_STRVU|nr:unnamed protein product [Strongylus vulgaris]
MEKQNEHFAPRSWSISPGRLVSGSVHRSVAATASAKRRERCQTLSLDSGIDYRRIGGGDSDSYFVQSPECDANKQCDRIFKQLIAQETDTVRSKTLNILGRNLVVEKCCGGVADIDFADVGLCYF